jgi:hypothetical protein
LRPHNGATGVDAAGARGARGFGVDAVGGSNCFCCLLAANWSRLNEGLVVYVTLAGLSVGGD